MNLEKLIEYWHEEERAAHIRGWDFSHIQGRYTEETDLPWDYRNIVLHYLTLKKNLLDIDTGGGEFLRSLHHPPENTSATEGYPPNAELCRQILLPLGINFKVADAKDRLPFEDAQFDMVINRHGDYNVYEVQRVLKPNGLFITQQVGAENDRELVNLLLPDIADPPFPDQHLHIAVDKFKSAGFRIIREQECFRTIRFCDVGALVWFAHIIEWEFSGFSVDKCINRLILAQQQLEKKGFIEGKIHRFLIVSQKMEY